MRVCLFEDRGSAYLEPLSLTRPVFELLCGVTSLGGKQSRCFAPCELGVLVRPQLADLYRLHHPETPVNDDRWLRSGPTVLVNGRWLPPPDASPELAGPCVALAGDQVAYAVVGADLLADVSIDTIDECLEDWKNNLPGRSAGGSIITYPWDLVELNAEQIHLDSLGHFPRQRLRPPTMPASVVGPVERVRLDPTAQFDPLVVFDTTHGPVVVEAQAVVKAFSRLEGPCYVGPQTQVLGAKIRPGTTLGPNCRVGGEVENCIIQGHSNKYHDGFLGHSYIGEWVNIGAGTQSSDLRNDYGEVSVTVHGRPVPTGLMKVGCFVGDYSRMGLGTLLNTGSNIGAFCNLLPSGTLLPRYLPSFSSWWNGSLVDRSQLAELGQTAGEMMRRRGCAFSEVHAELAGFLHEQTAAERRHAVREFEFRRLRRSA